MAVPALLTPLLAFVPNPVALGLIYGSMFFLHPTWGSAIGADQVSIVPDHLQSRVQSVILMLALGAVPLGSLIVGLLLRVIGPSPTVPALSGLMLLVAVAAAMSRSVRLPRLEG